MADEVSKPEPFDEFADQFTITTTPFGANLSFSVRDINLPADQPAQSRYLGTVRMNIENLKAMVLIVHHQVLRAQRGSGFASEVPHEILDKFQITVEEWNTFWKIQ